MTPCISQATTLGTPFEADLDAYARGGWTAIELWLTKIEQTLARLSLDELASRLRDAGLVPAAAAAQGGLLGTKGAEREAHLEHFRRRLSLLGALGVPTLVVVPEFARAPHDEELGRAAADLAEAARMADAFGVRLALEFQKTASFCASLDTALALVEASGAGNVGVCFDVFHYYTGPSKFEDLTELNPRSLAHVQLSDLRGTPRELASDGDRILPGDGDIPLAPIVVHLRRIGYAGYVSLEVTNPKLWSIAADRVADVGLRAILRVLDENQPCDPAARAGGF